MTTSSPSKSSGGSIEDMENMDAMEKVTLLRAHKAWKCQKKWEVLHC